jgi:hypothetical protein
MKYLLKFNESWLGDRVKSIVNNSDEAMAKLILDGIDDDLVYHYFKSKNLSSVLTLRKYEFSLPNIKGIELHYDKGKYNLWVSGKEIRCSKSILEKIYNKLESIRKNSTNI